MLRGLGLPDEAYTYDAIGNRLGSRHQPVTQWGNGSRQETLTYTPTGNLKQKVTPLETVDYNYDVTDRLAEVKRNDATVATYQYDPFGRRFSKRVNGELTYYLYSDEGLIAEFDEQGKLQVAYGWEPDSYWGTSPLWQANIATGGTLKTATYHYLQTDHLGTPQIATETGTHYNYFRDYNPRTGRYQQSDPIGLGGGINFYVYVYANPNLYIDPIGLQYIYGKWCGLNWTGGYKKSWDQLTDDEKIMRYPPIDAIDACCQAHDICHAEARENNPCDEVDQLLDMQSCDAVLSSCVDNNTKGWEIVKTLDFESVVQHILSHQFMERIIIKYIREVLQ